MTTSVFAADGLDQRSVREMGRAHVATRERPTLYGYAQIEVFIATKIGLQVRADEPPVRHAVICGWPDGPAAKAEQKSLAQKLAADAQLNLFTDIEE